MHRGSSVALLAETKLTTLLFNKCRPILLLETYLTITFFILERFEMVEHVR